MPAWNNRTPDKNSPLKLGRETQAEVLENFGHYIDTRFKPRQGREFDEKKGHGIGDLIAFPETDVGYWVGLKDGVFQLKMVVDIPTMLPPVLKHRLNVFWMREATAEVREIGDKVLDKPEKDALKMIEAEVTKRKMLRLTSKVESCTRTVDLIRRFEELDKVGRWFVTMLDHYICRKALDTQFARYLQESRAPRGMTHG